ncbi:MAG: UDP-N-acetylmuramate--L-alanine ligase [Chlamydiae bacterium RIFCSPHIGHO2_12_FULL_44_59]|nr:MAG: UDP-N-acetylmuramate--L-alanine ligase [Chlamydiae bacterium RIFCSPHIGHO2_01_FULL_44_39]OGN59192.1 MAG: UDP-N-acetylmuramate--L-alanine ligase [Chlamydiae bacterium RIFCSPHIGHO2_02_FULL_45_9]OGN60124.1 MAG: UDP-N-acetylmuramate--L-alanine ligase [Chlamydiae bacterium RIFCSPHIGHO2_12_FULL_44_59]OGN66281.1 MAG: UDP-N-acetylmuramate--L-alanine ligase [Chlamydiae bacterium RIFCSPLOWO2_01_FULL_44_52]OGN68929.1 MAG: UDP-N-acetylmuramate--L-alanine ligase [Chlamydiae bacterium RIFCSPLOWO2_02_F
MTDIVYHFIGLGGIGMSALAKILLQRGRKVQGSDLTSNALLKEMETIGAKVHIGHHSQCIGDATTIVYSSGIKGDNVELIEAKRRKLPILHRSELLDFLAQPKKKILVAGTHGKTTTTALLAHVMKSAGLDPSFVVGGMARCLQTNGKEGQGEHFVMEADESDGSFLKTRGDYAILTNLTDEHLDYWGSSQALDVAFQQFVNQTKELFFCYDDERLRRLKMRGTSYGFLEGADLQIANYCQTDSGITYDLGEFAGIEVALFGRHNALNSAAIFALAMHLNISEEVIRKAFLSFSGTSRRLELKTQQKKVQLFDDYGHHPREIRATLQALRDRIREKRLVCVFQPHRFSRVKDNLEAFSTAFREADLVFMTEIYAAQETPIEGLEGRLFALLREQMGERVHFVPKDFVVERVALSLLPHDVVLTLGAGDVTSMGPSIMQHYVNHAPKLKVSVLYGGTSAEHAVSCMSAKNIVEALDRSIYSVAEFPITREGDWGSLGKIPPKELLDSDVCIPVFHGPQGEDGMVAALLDALDIPYVGCDYRSGAVCMQKGWSKEIVSHYNVPVVPYLTIKKSDYRIELDEGFQRIMDTFSFPIWVKPAHLGSSIGVSSAQDLEELKTAMECAFLYDHVLLVEKHIEGRQIEFGIMGNEYLQIASPAEIVNHGAFVAYDKKYGAGAMKIRAPADITRTEKERGCELAKRVFLALGCSGLARVDFFLDSQGSYWFNEINPFPGFTTTSAFPMMWEAMGMTRETINDVLIFLALHKKRHLKAIRGRQ